MRGLERGLLRMLRRPVCRQHLQLLPRICMTTQNTDLVRLSAFRSFSICRTNLRGYATMPGIFHSKDPRKAPQFTPGSFLLFLLASGYITVVIRGIWQNIADELEEAQDWRGVDTTGEEFDSVTIGSDDHQFSEGNEVPIKLVWFLRYPVMLFRRLRRGARQMFRLTVLAVRFVPLLARLGFLIYIASSRGEMDMFQMEVERSLSDQYRTWWQNFADALEKSGPAFIKLGQYLSSRPDLFSDSVCSILASLRDSTAPHAWSETEKILEDALGDDWAGHLHIPSKIPIGSGCIAQVYRGVYRDQVGDSVDVAVKVQHPTALAQVVTDLQLIHKIARIQDQLPNSPFEAVSLQSQSVEFARLMHSQLDQTQECRNQKRFQRNFKRPSSAAVQPKFPTPLEASKKVLIETFHEGVGAATLMTEVDIVCSKPCEVIFAALPADSRAQLKKDIAECGLDAFLHMQFAHGFFHADLHPGNMMFDFGFSANQEAALVQYIHEHGRLPEVYEHDISHEEDIYLRSQIPEAFLAVHGDDLRLHEFSRTPAALYRAIGLPVPARPPQLVMIDAGMATALTERDQNNFNDLFYNIASGDGYEAAALMIERARPMQKSPTAQRAHDATCVKMHGYKDHGACPCGLYGPQETHILSNKDKVTLNTQPRAPKQTRMDRRQFIESVGALANAAQKKSFKLDGMGVVSTLQTLAQCARENGIALDCAFVSVVIAVTVMEGFGRALDPHCDVLGPALTIVAKCGVHQAKKRMEKLLDSESNV